MKSSCTFCSMLYFIFWSNLAFSQNSSYFIENKGQWDKEVLYLYQSHTFNAWVTQHGVVYDFFKEPVKLSPDISLASEQNYTVHKEMPVTERHGHVVRISHKNSSRSVQSEGRQALEGYYNYFHGNDPGKWASYVGLYKEAYVRNIYTGIDQKWYFDGGSLRYDYIVKPNGDYRQIEILIEGADGTEIKGKDLVFRTRFGEVKQAELYVYQNIGGNKVKVDAQWQKKGQQFGFSLSEYNPDVELIIDPLIYSTFIGGSSADYPNGIVLDAASNAIITGRTYSNLYPTTAGSYDVTYNNAYDVFVSKMDISGNLIFSTYIGGTSSDNAWDIAIDGNQDIYVVVETTSNNYPTSTGCFDNSYSWGDEIAVTKLNASGSGLLYSTYIGGNDADEGYAIAVDALGNAYITGATLSTDYPVTAGAYDVTFNGGSDVIITKLNSTGTALVYSTFIGGNDWDYGFGIAVDNFNNAYITGYTPNGTYPTTAGSFSPFYSGGGQDAFVTKINAAGNALVYSTFIGSATIDVGRDIAVYGNSAYITGETFSGGTFPVTAGSYDPTHNGSIDIFVTKLNIAGSALDFSTYIGGSIGDLAYGIAIDPLGNVYVVGYTGSTNFPTTAGAHDASYNGGTGDIVISKLNPAGSTLLYSSYIGGSAFDGGWSSAGGPKVAADASEKAFITGYTSSSNYPTTSGCYDNTYNSSDDVVLSVFCTNLLTMCPVSLPVSLPDLQAHYIQQDNAVLLSWNNLPENTEHILLERSELGLWQIIHNTRLSINHHVFTDKTFPHHVSTLHYRLKCITKDGNYLYSDIKTVYTSPNNVLQVYPNPAKNSIYVDIFQNDILYIMDNTGKTVSTHAVYSGKNELSFALPAGIYWIKLSSEYTTFRFIVTE